MKNRHSFSKFLFLAVPLIIFSQNLLAENQTVITSEQLEFKTDETNNIFLFRENVEIQAEDLHATCQCLQVISERTSEASSRDMSNIGAVDLIIADGDVVIEQADRVAEAGHAEIFPKEGKIVLTENPKVTDPDGVVEGFRMVLYQNERKAFVEGHKDGGRPKVILPSMPSLSFEPEAEAVKEDSEKEEAS